MKTTHRMLQTAGNAAWLQVTTASLQTLLYIYFLLLFYHFLSTYTFPHPEIGLFMICWSASSEPKHWITQTTFVGGFGQPESSSLTANPPCDNWEGFWFTNAAEMAETEVPEVEWRSFSGGELGGVVVQLLNNQLMAPDWSLRSSAKAETLITVGF